MSTHARRQHSRVKSENCCKGRSVGLRRILRCHFRMMLTCDHWSARAHECAFVCVDVCLSVSGCLCVYARM